MMPTCVLKACKTTFQPWTAIRIDDSLACNVGRSACGIMAAATQHGPDKAAWDVRPEPGRGWEDLGRWDGTGTWSSSASSRGGGGRTRWDDGEKKNHKKTDEPPSNPSKVSLFSGRTDRLVTGMRNKVRLVDLQLHPH